MLQDGITANRDESGFQIAPIGELIEFFSTTINSDATRFDDIEPEGYQCI
jgi:hypothetical protein